MNEKGHALPCEQTGRSTTRDAYDNANRLSKITQADSFGHGMSGPDDSAKEKDTAASRNAGKGKAKTTTVHFTYDGDGVRTEKSVTSQSKTDATQYLWDINHGLPQVLTESGKKGTAQYSYGLGRISMADLKKGPMYYQYDGLGSVRSLTDRKG